MSIKQLCVIGRSVGRWRAHGRTPSGFWRSCRPDRIDGGLILALLVLTAGCSKRQEPAAASNLRLSEAEQHERMVLSEAQQREVRRAMESVAEGHQPVSSPSVGVRFSDVPAAAEAACARVEAAIIERLSTGDEMVFRVRTVENWPGELRVRRLEGPRVYEAEAWIGRFPEMPERKRRAVMLLRAFEQEMEAFGRKRGWEKG